MPSYKFWNLDSGKKDELIRSAKEEFASKSYENASINKIIKSINMPRGSFYLYFENKEDLYIYILKTYIKEFKIKLIEILKTNSGDIFDSLLDFYEKIVSDNNFDQKLITNIFINLNFKQLDTFLPTIIEEEMDLSVITAMNIDNYIIDSSEIEDLLSILIPLFLHAVAISLEDNCKKDIVKVHYLKQLNIIKRGLERKETC